MPSVVICPSPILQFFNNNGTLLSGGSVLTQVSGVNAPTYSDSAGTILLPNPIPLNSRGEVSTAAGASAQLFLPANTVYTFTLFDALGNQIEVAPYVNGVQLTLTQANVGAALYPQTAAEITAGVTPANYAYVPGHVLRYHATGTIGVSASNDTTALLNTYNVCIQATNSAPASCDGYIPSGNYFVNEGVLVFDNGFTDKAWPVIRTAGQAAVTFTGQAFADAPILTWKNGTATNAAGAFWRGGSHGGVTFKTTRVSGSNSHGISITGLWGLHFGNMKGVNLVGDLLHQPQNLFNGTVPDPYAVALCIFDLLEGVGCAWVYNNLNGVGASDNTFMAINSNAQKSGCVFDGGSSTSLYVTLSFGPGLGWAFDVGPTLADRLTILNAEIDGTQFGFRINAGYGNNIRGLRIIHEFQLSPNVSANYWPRRAVDITGLAAPNLHSTYIQAIHRVDPGGAHKDLGIFCDFHGSNATSSDVIVEQNLTDQAGITYTDADFVRGMGINQPGVVLRDGRRITDERVPALSKVAGSAATSIVNTGFGTSASIVSFPTVRYDPDGLFNTTTNLWLAPFSGPACFKACLALTVASATKVRLAIVEMIANAIATTGSLIAGSGYTNGTYTNVLLTGGTGQGAQATITVAGGVVTVVTMTANGGNYTVGDVLSAFNGDIGGTGTGFSVNVATVTALAVSTFMINRVDYAIASTVQSYSIDGECAVIQGRAYCLMADQSTAGSVTPSIPSGAYEPDLYFQAEMANMP